MTDSNKSVDTEEMEVTTLENVSLDETDVEQPKQTTQEPAEKTANTKRLCAILLIAFLCLIVGAAIVLAVALGGGKTKSTTSAQKATSGNETRAPYVPPIGDDPFGDNIAPPFGDVTLRAFSSDITEGYASIEEFEADLTKMAEFIVNNIVLWNIHHYGQSSYDDDFETVGDDFSTVAAMDSAVSVAQASATGEAERPTKSKKHSKTKNQEKDADEADIVKSDDDFIYIVNGYSMLVLDHNGKTINEVNATFQDEWGYHTSLYIHAIFLTNEHVLVVSEGYDNGYYDYGYDDYSYSASGLYDRDVTHLTAYTKPTIEDPSMKEVGSESFNGYYQDGRWMQESNSIQILTFGSTATWDMVDQLSPSHYPWVTREEYAEKAAAKASQSLIPDFVKSVTRDLKINGELPSMLRLNAWTKKDQTDAWKHFGEYFAIEEFFSGYTTVTSFSLSELTASNEMKPSASVLFAPSTSAIMYGTDDNIVLALSKSEWDEEEQHTHESTFLMNMNIVAGGAAEWHSIAKLEGQLHSRYALDVQGNDLRVATTVQKWFALDNVWETCGDNYYLYEDACMTESLWDKCMNVTLTCPKGKVVKTGCPYTITCESDGAEVEDVSSTDNYVTVFDIEQEGEMTEVGRLRIGEPHEVITAIRFGDTFSYAMTFDQTDPFYVLKLDAGEPPAISGSVTLQGFSTFLHFDEEANLLVGIGRNTTGTGLDQVTSRVMISVFDVSDPSNPQVVDGHMLDEDTSSQGEWDFKSATFSNGKLILPAEVYHYFYDDDFMAFDDDLTMDADLMHLFNDTGASSEENFEGFIVFDVQGNGGIKELFRVNHAKAGGECSYCSSNYWEARSFLYDDGSLLTVRGHYFISTDVATGEEVWKVEPHTKGDTKDCCW